MGAGISYGSTGAGAWIVIQTGTGAMDITAIPTGFKLLRLIIQTTASAGGNIQFNGDTGANYNYQLYTKGGPQHGEAQTGITVFTEGATYQVLLALDIMNISNAVKNVAGVMTAWRDSSTNNDTGTVGGTWMNTTDEINEIKLNGVSTTKWALMGVSGL